MSQRARMSDDPRFVPPVVIGVDNQVQLNTLTDRLRATRELLAAATETNNNQRGQINVLAGRLRQLRGDEYEDCQEQLNASVAEVEQLRDEVAGLQEQLKEAQGYEQATRQELQQCRAEGEADRARIVAAGDQMEEMRVALEGLQGELATKQQRIQELDEQIRDLFGRVDTVGIKRRRTQAEQKEEVEGEEEKGGEGGGLPFDAGAPPAGGFDFLGSANLRREQRRQILGPQTELVTENADREFIDPVSGRPFYAEDDGTAEGGQPNRPIYNDPEFRDEIVRTTPYEQDVEERMTLDSEHVVNKKKLTPLNLSSLHKLARLKI